MQRKDIPDSAVLSAYVVAKQIQAGWPVPIEVTPSHNSDTVWPYDVLMAIYGCPFKVAWSAIERADRHGLLEVGVSVRSAYLTEKGKQVLLAAKEAREHEGTQ